jgi:hypothetical protein
VSLPFEHAIVDMACQPDSMYSSVSATPELPGWLKASASAPSSSACQAAPMVLSMEDPCQSTPEVLQQELAQQLEEQLEALDIGQLQALKDAVCRQMVLGQ